MPVGVGLRILLFAISSVTAVTTVGIWATVFRLPQSWTATSSSALDPQSSGEITGAVGRVDTDGTVWIARSILDFSPRGIRFRPQTTIQVGSKEGGLGDIRAGAHLVVRYEVDGSDLVARSAAVYRTRDELRSARSRMGLEQRQDNETPVPAAVVVSPPPEPLPPPVSIPADEVPEPRPSPIPSRPSPPSGQAQVSKPSAAAASQREPSGPASPPVRKSDPEDPRGVIDWLLRK